MTSKLLLMYLLIVSPIWPLGENPLIGDPFIIVNKSSNEMAFIVDGKVDHVYKVATGRTEMLTPEGEFTIVVKAENPYYRRKNIEGGSKENPLGTRWIGFDAEETDGRIYGIHGNNDPHSIGQYITGGCVRMFNEEVEELFTRVPYGTKVFITSTDKDFHTLAREKGAIK
ncbi:L,D-transpeptidase [Anaerobacillus alkaliphilus]|uniref:L,D-transpeptidase n=1 Tax=Anaerobacillus alkaliphilus TaxID=1548597 RepID=A0A4Q0VSH5_9BACI|nr:L,D-transpeptidase [Anaerobacillus alkaliphilus]RXI99549.1 L,D-transpeptidase [Anaerobacillus alkaliphilus]